MSLLKTYHQPFLHIEIKNFLPKKNALKLLNALVKEPLYLKESDLFKFKQTKDLSTSNSTQEFIKALKDNLTNIERITNHPLNPNKIDTSVTQYEDTDFLLCHDDKLEKRGVAFMYYLSTLKEKDGGCLNLYKTKNRAPRKVMKKIYPSFNTLIVFPVTSFSFHAVEEVISNKKRITLSGWVYEN